MECFAINSLSPKFPPRHLGDSPWAASSGNTHECNHLLPLLEGIADGTTVYADKGYDSA